VEGADPRPAPLTGPTGDATDRPDWADIEPPDEDEAPGWDEPPAEEPDAVAEPVVAEPVVEKPLVDEPVVQDAVVDEPQVDEALEEAAAGELAAEPDEPATDHEPARRARAPIALGVVLVLLLGVLGWLVVDARDTRDRDDARQAALQAARQQAVNLTTISYQTADADLGRIISAATGTLKTQFEAQRAQFPDVLKRDKSVSVGTVLAAGVASQSKGTVEALVAVDAAVSNDQTAKAGGRPLVKHYRMDMKLVLVGGRWLVSQVAFAGLPQ
jgi:Mce-associated membrane protein